MKKMSLVHKVSLIGKIKGLAAEARHARGQMKKSKESDNETRYYKYRNVKEYVRHDARHHVLAYAYMRGVPYSVLENKCNTKPIPEKILNVVMMHSYFMSQTFYKENLIKIKNWLEGK